MPLGRPRLTTRGWGLVGAAVTLYVAARVLGTVELAMLAAGIMVVLVAAVVVVEASRPDVTARRTLHPERLHVGVPARAEIEVTNRGRRRTGLLSVVDGFSGRREARFAAAPIAPGATGRGAYRIPTGRRGVFAVGPLVVAATDPLGLLRRPVRTAPREQVTVFPRVERICPLPGRAGADLVGGASHEFVRSRSGDEFHSLRQYVVGDDLRKVHWRSTARTGELMIRELDEPWQTRATVLLDVRSRVHSGGSLEQAVEAAASIVTALHRDRAIIRLVTTDGGEVGFGSGRDHYEAVMEHLAVVGVDVHDRFDDVVSRLARQGTSGALVAVTGRLDAVDAEAAGLLAGRFRFGVVVGFGGPGGGARPAASTAGARFDVGAHERFADVWNAAFLSGRLAAGIPGRGPR